MTRSSVCLCPTGVHSSEEAAIAHLLRRNPTSESGLGGSDAGFVSEAKASVECPMQERARAWFPLPTEARASLEKVARAMPPPLPPPVLLTSARPRRPFRPATPLGRPLPARDNAPGTMCSQAPLPLSDEESESTRQAAPLLSNFATWPTAQLKSGGHLCSTHSGEESGAQRALFALVSGMTRSLSRACGHGSAPAAAAAGDAPADPVSSSPTLPFVFECSSKEAGTTGQIRQRQKQELDASPKAQTNDVGISDSRTGVLRILSSDSCSDKSEAEADARVVDWKSMVAPATRHAASMAPNKGHGGKKGAVGSGAWCGSGGRAATASSGSLRTASSNATSRRRGMRALEGATVSGGAESEEESAAPQRPNTYAQALARLAAEDAAAHARRRKGRRGKRSSGKAPSTSPRVSRGRRGSDKRQERPLPKGKERPRRAAEAQGRQQQQQLASPRPVISVSLGRAQRACSARNATSASSGWRYQGRESCGSESLCPRARTPPPPPPPPFSTPATTATSLLPPPPPPPLLNPSVESAVAAYASALSASGDGEGRGGGGVDGQTAPDHPQDSSLAFWLRLICGPRRDDRAVDSLLRSQQVFAGCARLLAANPPPPSRAGRANCLLCVPVRVEGPLSLTQCTRPGKVRESVLFTRYLSGHRVRRARRHTARSALRRALLVMAVVFAPASGPAPAPAPAFGSWAAPVAPAGDSASNTARHDEKDDKTAPSRWAALAAAKSIWARAEAVAPAGGDCGALEPSSPVPAFPLPKLPVYVLPHVASKSSLLTAHVACS